MVGPIVTQMCSDPLSESEHICIPILLTFLFISVLCLHVQFISHLRVVLLLRYGEKTEYLENQIYVGANVLWW